MDAEERWRILRLHVEDKIPLAAVARDTGISVRTLQCRTDGTGTADDRDWAIILASTPDAGRRRTAAETVAFIERLSLTRPRPSIATLPRLTAAETTRQERPDPSYATVREIVRSLDPALVTLALEGPGSYRNRLELVLRRRADQRR